MLLLVAVECLSGLVLLSGVRRILPGIDLGLRRTALFMAVVPAAMLLILYNCFFSLVTNRICWRGTTYELRSRNQIIVRQP